ncbi:MAG TPA: transporter [Pyrinomonadaceae bacterium]|nr:transporter [Pyrinomonadaceae bacterium]
MRYCSPTTWALVLFITGALGGFVNVQAQDQSGPDFIVPARPTVSNPAEFQKPGVLQLEVGYNANFRAPGIHLQQDMPLALRFAVSRRVLLEFDGDSPSSQSEAGVGVTGAGDSQLGIQVVLHHENDKRPGVSVAYYIKLPTADSIKGLGTGRVDHNFIALVSKKIRGTTVDFNAFYLVSGRTTDNGHASSGQAAFAASHNVRKRAGIQGELSGYSRNDEQSGALFALAAFTYQIKPRLVIDTGLRFGLTHDAPRTGFFAGLTVGICDLYKHQHRSASVPEGPTLDHVFPLVR